MLDLFRHDPSDSEMLQHILTLAHRECQREDSRHRAENKAEVKHKWPRMAAWLQSETQKRVWAGVAEPWEK